MKKIIASLILIFCLLPTFAQERAKPRQGEGVSTFLRRHGRAGTIYHREFKELNKGKFSKDDGLLLGVTYTLPPLKESLSKSAHREPLFGKELEYYDVVSTELVGATFYISSGHGGPDPGAIGKMGAAELHEDEYAYDISLRLARALLMKGAKVHMIIQDAEDGIREQMVLPNSKRETCMGKTIPLNQLERLQQRANAINELYRKERPAYSRAIFIHIDSRNKSEQTDVYFYHSQSDASNNLAHLMRDTFRSKYKQSQPNRVFNSTVSYRNLYMLTNSTPVALYMELGNIQNSFDQQRFILSNNRQALANWICAGLVADYKKNK